MSWLVWETVFNSLRVLMRWDEVMWTSCPNTMLAWQFVSKLHWLTLLAPICRLTSVYLLVATIYKEKTSHTVLSSFLNQWTILVQRYITNEYDCSFLSLSSLFRCVSSLSILQSVSIMHECSPTCVAKRVNSTSQVERQCIASQKIMFVHDFCNNNLYIYCMHSSL